MRRKPGTLIAIEQSILAAAIILRSTAEEEFHGYRIAREVKNKTDARHLTSHGTLYRALARLEQTGFLVSRWEDPVLAAREGRPLRKLYRLTLWLSSYMGLTATLVTVWMLLAVLAVGYVVLAAMFLGGASIVWYVGLSGGAAGMRLLADRIRSRVQG